MNEDVERLRSEVAELRTALERCSSQVELAIRKVQELELAQRVATMTESEDGGMVTPRVMVSHIPQLCGEDPKPYTVEWSKEEECWLIWIPDQGAALYLDNVPVYLETPGGASETRADGWYKIPDSLLTNDYCVLCVHVTFPDTPGADPDTEWVSEYDGPYEDGCAYIVAVLDKDTDTGEHVVLQLVDSAVMVTTGEGGGGETPPDMKSIDKKAAGNTKLELLEFQTKAVEADTLAKAMVQQSSAGQEFVERGEDAAVANGKIVKYRKQGYFYAGENTNITFTPDANGNVAIQVRYV